MRKILEGWIGGIRVGGRRINNLRFADDTALCVMLQVQVKELLDRVESESVKLVSVDTEKTKVIIIDRAESLPETYVMSEYEEVDHFIYLAPWFGGMVALHKKYDEEQF